MFPTCVSLTVTIKFAAATDNCLAIFQVQQQQYLYWDKLAIRFAPALVSWVVNVSYPSLYLEVNSKAVIRRNCLSLWKVANLNTC